MTPGDATTASPRARRGHLAQRPRPGRCRAPRPSPGPRPRPCPRRAAPRPRCRRRTRPAASIAPSSVATWVASRIGVSTPSAPVRSSSAIVVSSAHSSPESGADVQLERVGVERDGARARQLAASPTGLRVWRSRPSTPSPVATHTRSPARADATSPSRRGSIAASRTAVVTWLLAATSRPANSDDAAGHHVLREVRMRPLVDRVVDAVAPRLQELGRGPRVVDLVEVHPGGLGEPEHPEAHARDDEHDEDPQVQPVQPAAALAVQEA